MNILDIVVKSCLVSLAGLGLAYALRRSSAAARHLALALTLVGMAVLPLVTPMLPAWRLPFYRVSVQAAPPLKVSTAPSPIRPYAVDPLVVGAAAYALVATLLGCAYAMRLLKLKRLERSLPMCADPFLHSVVADYCRQLGRHVLLLEGGAQDPPMTWGHVRPVLMLPSAAAQWPDERLRAVVLHELAHVERGDWLATTLASGVCAVFWFNPLAWIVKSRMDMESESAADDRVLTSGVNSTDYASHLLDLVKEMSVARQAEAALGMAKPDRLDRRVRAILEERRARTSARGSAALGIVSLMAILVALVGAAAPTLVKDSETADTTVAINGEVHRPGLLGDSSAAGVSHVSLSSELLKEAPKASAKTSKPHNGEGPVDVDIKVSSDMASQPRRDTMNPRVDIDLPGVIDLSVSDALDAVSAANGLACGNGEIPEDARAQVKEQMLEAQEELKEGMEGARADLKAAGVKVDLSEVEKTIAKSMADLAKMRIPKAEVIQRQTQKAISESVKAMHEAKAAANSQKRGSQTSSGQGDPAAIPDTDD